VTGVSERLQAALADRYRPHGFVFDRSVPDEFED
jgi:hypothetical protein